MIKFLCSLWQLFFVLVGIGVLGLTPLQINADENEVDGYSGVFVQGNYAYCVSRETGLDIIEISDPANPIKKGNFNTTGIAVYVDSNLAYIPEGLDGIKIIDISDPSSPGLVGAYDPFSAWNEAVFDVFVSGNYAYLSDWYYGLHIIDISDPSSPAFTGSYDTPGQGYKLHVDGNHAYVADGYGGLQILNIQDPSTPTVEGVFDTPNYFVYDVFVKNNYAYIIDAEFNNYFLKVIDVRNPSSPGLRGTCILPALANDIYIEGNYAYLACGGRGLQIVSISQPSSPFIEDSYDTDGDAAGVYVKDSYVYIADKSKGLVIFYIPESSPPGISLSRTLLNFGAGPSGTVSGPQTFVISNSGEGTLNWRITDNVDWLSYSPDSGQGPAMISVTANPAGLAAGTHPAAIAVSDINAANNPQFIEVSLTVFDWSTVTGAFGNFATPVHGSVVSSSIPVTGWVLDDIGVESVKIYRTAGTGLAYIGDAVFVEGARPDIEQAFPGYPDNYKAGWGYMMLTNFLPNEGNGTFQIHAAAIDLEGNETLLGTKTITCDNANAVKPFGAIDTPAQGGTVSGSNFINWGWVLTPQPNTIPTDGSTINVWVDGVYLGHPTYNSHRSDIANLLPGYNNSNGAGGYFYFDTAAYEDGVHSIYWTAEDDAGNIDGIGSRYFTIRNAYGASAASHKTGLMQHGTKIPGNISTAPVHIEKGCKRQGKKEILLPGEKGLINIEIEELERLEINFDGTAWCNGFLVVGAQLRPLPIGSTFDRERGMFVWQPGPGFYGDYEFVFIKAAAGAGGNEREKTGIKVAILPKYPGE